MKIRSSLLMALGIVSQPVLAQTQSLPSRPAATMTAADITGPVSGPDAASASADMSSGSSGPMQSEAGVDLQALSPTAGLKPVTQDDVTYLCGGVGEAEEAFMKKKAGEYDLMLTFATRSGAYLANVDVDIRDARGNTVLQTNCGAPILLVDLPRSGNYRVRAETAGYEMNQAVKVAAGRKKANNLAAAVISWPQQVAEAGGMAPISTGDSGDSQSGSRRSGDGTR
jgi:hypothetical protein